MVSGRTPAPLCLLKMIPAVVVACRSACVNTVFCVSGCRYALIVSKLQEEAWVYAILLPGLSVWSKGLDRWQMAPPVCCGEGGFPETTLPCFRVGTPLRHGAKLSITGRPAARVRRCHG